MQELRKEEYRLARRNYTNKSIELTVKYYRYYQISTHLYCNRVLFGFYIYLLGSGRLHSQFESLQ